jgi:predicted dehydrogenase
LNKVFFDWLTDPEKNGAGALMDFGCYNALWSLWYLGKPETVYAQVNQLRPGEFPKVEDNSTFIFSYKNGVGLFEGSWDFPRSFQDLEVFGRSGSLYLRNGSVELRKGRENGVALPITDLPAERAEIGKAEVVGNDQQHVGSRFGLRCRLGCASERTEQRAAEQRTAGETSRDAVDRDAAREQRCADPSGVTTRTSVPCSAA